LAEKTIPVESVEPLLLFGFNDQYLRKVEAAFPEARVVARGNQVHLRGSDADVARIERVLAELALVLHRNGNLTENDVETVLALEAGPTGASTDASDAILFTPAGGTVRARTPGQVHLVEAARRHDIVFAIGPAGTGKCVAADTLVLTDEGLVPIGNLAQDTQPGDNPPLARTVYGLNGPEPTSHFYDGGESDTLRVTTRGGFAIEATPEHPLLVLTESGALEWRRADSLRPGDMLSLQRGQRFFGHTTHVGFRSAPESAAREVVLDDLDEDLAYFVGLIVGDGCLTPPRSVLLSTADDEIRAALERTAARFGLSVGRNGRTRAYDYAIHSTGLRDLLFALGCSPGRAHEKHIPAAILRAPEPIVAAFLQGLFDTDGSIDRRDGTVTFSTVSERLAKEVQTILLNLGVVAMRGVKRGRYQGQPHLSQRLTMAGAEAERFHERVGFRLERKRALRQDRPANPNVDVVPHMAGLIDTAIRLVTLSRAQHRALYDYRTGRRRPGYEKLGAMVSLLGAAGVAEYVLSPIRNLLTQRLLFLEVESITPGRARVFDLTVPGTHSFVANGFVNHNTWTAVALAVSALKSRQVKKIVLCRPAVEAGENLGFLPGGLRDKVDPYLRPLYDALEEMMGVEKLRSSLDQNTVEIVPLAYMRGRTLHNAFVILDEAQNATAAQMKMFLTRLGAGSRAIVTGDATQTDLPARALSGLTQARDILEGIEGIAFVAFDKGDVVRHRLVKEIIEAYERLEESNAGAPGAAPAGDGR